MAEPSDLADRVRAFFEARPERIVAVWLFGSEARGRARPDSDVDVAVLFHRAPPATLEGRPFDVEDALARALGRTVQLVVLNDAPAELVHHVLRDGLLLVERDRAARVRFEVGRRREYLDLLPVLREYRHPGSVLRRGTP